MVGYVFSDFSFFNGVVESFSVRFFFRDRSGFGGIRKVDTWVVSMDDIRFSFFFIGTWLFGGGTLGFFGDVLFTRFRSPPFGKMCFLCCVAVPPSALEI